MMTARFIKILVTDYKYLQSSRTVIFLEITIGYDFRHLLFAQHILFASKIKNVRYGLNHVPHRMLTLNPKANNETVSHGAKFWEGPISPIWIFDLGR